MNAKERIEGVFGQIILTKKLCVRLINVDTIKNEV